MNVVLAIQPVLTRPLLSKLFVVEADASPAAFRPIVIQKDRATMSRLDLYSNCTINDAVRNHMVAKIKVIELYLF